MTVALLITLRSIGRHLAFAESAEDCVIKFTLENDMPAFDTGVSKSRVALFGEEERASSDASWSRSQVWRKTCSTESINRTHKSAVSGHLAERRI